MRMKICYKCKQELPTRCFHKRTKSLDGLESQCKDCCKEYIAAYYARNREKIKARVSAYRIANPKKKRKWSDVNRETIREQRRAWVSVNGEKVRKQRAKWREINREELNAHKREYREINRQQIRAKTRSWWRSNYSGVLSDGYVLTVLRRKFPLKFSEIPQVLIEAKRQQLKTYRFIKERINEQRIRIDRVP